MGRFTSTQLLGTARGNRKPCSANFYLTFLGKNSWSLPKLLGTRQTRRRCLIFRMIAHLLQVWKRYHSKTIVNFPVDESLKLLGLDYVDIIQVHDCEFAPNIDIILNETLPALEKVKKAGKAKFIGVTGYPLAVLDEIIKKSTVKIDLVLGEVHFWATCWWT